MNKIKSRIIDIFLKDRFILILIIFNALTLFFAGYVVTESQKIIFIIADNTFTTLFLIELLVKFREYGIKEYFNSGWNKLDFILIIVSIPALVSFVFNIEFFDASFLLIFRIFRVFKAFRFFKFIPNVEKLMTDVKRALDTSLFILIGFIIYIFIIGILSFYLFNGSGAEYFESPTMSLYSTFKIFTVEGWFDIPEAISINYSKITTFFTYIYFIFVVVTGGIIGLSLVNSIFVDSMLSDNTDAIENKVDLMRDELQALLQKLDKKNKQ